MVEDERISLYRLRAAELRALAESSSNWTLAVEFRNIADSFDVLAEIAEKRAKISAPL